MSGGAKAAAPRNKNAVLGAERYLVTEVVHYIGGRLVKPGEIVQLPEGVKPGDKLVQVDDAGNPVKADEKPKAEAKADEKPKQ
jgi:hypothetical protein